MEKPGQNMIESCAPEGGVIFPNGFRIEIPPDVPVREETLAKAKVLAFASSFADTVVLGADAWVTFKENSES